MRPRLLLECLLVMQDESYQNYLQRSGSGSGVLISMYCCSDNRRAGLVTNSVPHVSWSLNRCQNYIQCAAGVSQINK